MNKHERLAQRLFDARKFPRVREHVSLRHFEKQDILVLRDRRTCERRDREWQGFRNYLYGHDCKILGERIASDYSLMLIDASSDMQPRLAREFSLLMLPLPIPGDTEPRHSVWGRVAVENGKPIGLYVNGTIVRQSVDRHWTEV